MEPADCKGFELTHTKYLDDFFAQLQSAARRLLLLDYDGTLAPFHIEPSAARPYPGIREQLDEIMRDEATQVVIISGRAAREVVPLLGLRRTPPIWGSHGWERLEPDGGYRCGPLDAAALRRLAADGPWVHTVKRHGGRLECKPGGVAVHWRGLAADQVADIRQTISRCWSAGEVPQTLAWSDFDGGIELRPRGRDKGYAVTATLDEHPGALAAYLGDDLTDEDAFMAIKNRGLGVLVRPQFRPTGADAWLRPPEQLYDFLSRWQATGRGGRL